MSVYKRGFVISFVLVIASIIVALILNYMCCEQFWCNVMLGIFGSSLLTAITSLIGYFAERKTVMEEFYTETLKLLNQFNRYQHDLSLEQKIGFYLSLSDYDLTDWNVVIGKMDFFKEENRKYIYDKIYKPLLDTYRTACSHSWHFRMHVNGTGVNKAVMQKFVEEIEPCILETKLFSYGDEEENEIVGSSIKNKIVEGILTELNGKYYTLMYGKKKVQKDVEGK